MSPDPAHGVFETLLAHDRRVQAWELHLARLNASTQALYGHSVGRDLLTDVRARLRGHHGDHRVRVSARPTAGGIDLSVEIAACDPALLARPVVLRPVRMTGGHGPHKWLDRRGLATPDHLTPLLLDTADEVLEAAWANVWIRERARLVTPPADGRMLPGITRSRLLALAPVLGVTAVIEPMSLARLRAADEVFLTSSLRQAVPAGVETAPAELSPLVAAVASELAATDWA